MQPGNPGNWQPAPVATPALQFASVGRRLVAYIIDAIILGVINIVVSAVLGSIGLAPYTVTTLSTGVDVNIVGLIVYLAIAWVISAAYFIYTWTSMRGTIGMRLLTVQIGNEGNGATLTMNQAAMRWVYLAGPGALVSVFSGFPSLSALVGLLVIIYYIALLYTTYQSPTKQGLHDQWAHTQVVAGA